MSVVNEIYGNDVVVNSLVKEEGSFKIPTNQCDSDQVQNFDFANERDSNLNPVG